MEAAQTPPRQRVTLPAAALIAVMAFGSVLMWIGLPLGWLWLGSRLQGGSSNPSMGAYALVIAGLPLSMVAIGKLLAKLDRFYARVTHAEIDQRPRRPWLKSMRGERGSGHRRTVLDVVMVASVSIAGIALLVWFFGFAGSSLPGS
jgi:hypothetical protein